MKAMAYDRLDAAAKKPVGVQVSYYLILASAFLATYQSLRPTELLITYSDLLLIAAGVMILFARGLPLNYFGPFTPVWHFFFVLLIGGLFVSSILNGAEAAWWQAGIQYVACYVFLPILFFVRTKERWRNLAIAFVAGVIVMEVVSYGIFLYYGGSYERLNFLGHDFYSGAGRWGAFVGNPNRHAAIICMTLPILYYLRSARMISVRVFYPAAGVLFTALIFTASNTGIATVVISAGAFIALGGMRIRPRHIIAALIAIAMLIVFEPPLPRAFESRVAGAIENQDLSSAGSFDDRFDLIKESWEYARENTLVGVGVDRYRELSSHRAPVHNSYLLIWVEGGVFALLGWIGMIGVMFVIAISGRGQYRLERALALSVLAAFLVFSTAAAHMYARIWMMPVVLALTPTLLAMRSHRS
jgi:O-antigen ligase